MNFEDFKKLIIPLEWRQAGEKILARAYTFDKEINFSVTPKDDYWEYSVTFGRREFKGSGSTLEKTKENAFNIYALNLSFNYNIEMDGE